MDKYIKIEDIKNAFIELSESGKWLGRTTTMNIIKALNNLPTIEVSEDCISREWILEEYQKGKEKISELEFFAELMWLVKNAPSVVPKRTNVECYARKCEKNKNGICEATDIILEFGCGE